MCKKLVCSAALILGASCVQPVVADYSDIQLVDVAVASNQFTFQLENPNPTAESTRAQVTVRLADGSTEVLTTAVVTIEGTTTSTVTATATGPIVEALDDPQPISP